MREDVLKLIQEEKLIAIVRGIAPEKCVAVCDALYEGGFRLMEITFNQKDPSSWKTTCDAITACQKKYEGRMFIGAGTVITVEQVELCKAAGGSFIVSPDTNVDVIKHTRELGMVSLPGALTPSEVLTAYNAGADYVKLFPISEMGPGYVKAVRAPISHVPMLAVGGVNEKNLRDYFEVGIAGAGIGGNLVNKKWIEAGEFDKITEVAKEMVAVVKDYFGK